MPIFSRQLRAFVVVAEELHFGRAARRLNISQPPLSQQVRQLEHELGAPLFMRTTRSVRLTAAGEFLIERARVLQEQAVAALDGARRIAAGELGSLTLGFTSSAAYRLLPEAITAFRTAFPGFELRLREQNSNELWEALLAERLDIALLRRNPSMQCRGLRFTPAGKERLVVAMPHDHRLAASKRVALRDLADMPLVGFAAGSSPYFHALIESLFAKARVQPHFVHESLMPTILSLVDARVGLALVPESASALWSERLTFRPLGGLGAGELARFHVAARDSAANPAVDGLVRIIAGISASRSPASPRAAPRRASGRA